MSYALIANIFYLVTVCGLVLYIMHVREELRDYIERHELDVNDMKDKIDYISGRLN